MKEYIAYDGDAFTIEWFFDKSGESEALEYYESLSDIQKRKTLILFKRMGDTGKIFDKEKFINEGDKIYAFKPQPDRFLSFFYTGHKIIVTNGYRKKSQKLPKQEKIRALDIKNNYFYRVEQEDYYEE